MSEFFKPLSPTTSRMPRDRRDDLLTTNVRGIVTQERAARDAKTAKLRALRLASEAESPPATEPPAQPARKKVTTDPGS